MSRNSSEEQKSYSDDTLNNIRVSELVPKAVRTINVSEHTLNIANATKTGYIECDEGNVFDMSYPNSMLRRGRVQGERGSICPTLTCNPDNLWVINDIKTLESSKKKTDSRNVSVELDLRKLTERECFRLMGLSDSEIDSILENDDSDLSSTAMYKMSGNSIVVNVLEGVFENMLSGYDYLPGFDSRTSDSSTHKNVLF